MTNDPLKDLFQEAFKKEDIPFDPSAWESMNQLLEDGHRKRSLWIAVSNMGGFALSIAFILLILNGNDSLYQPRFKTFLTNELQEPASNANTHQQTSAIDESTAAHRAAYPEPSDQNSTEKLTVTRSEKANSPDLPSPSNSNTGKVMASKNIDERRPYVTSINGLKGVSEITPPTPSETEEFDPTSSFSKIMAPDNNRADIALADRIVWNDALHQTATPKSRTVDEHMIRSARSVVYLRAGASRNFMLKTGQVGGFGFERQLAEHLLINAELNLARDHTYFNHVQEQVDYGFDQYNNALRVWASEMMHVELPVFLRLRWNRITVGSGITLGTLWSSSVTEERLASSALSLEHKQPIGERTELGYVNWSALRALQLGLPIDVQYQLDERYYIGGRFQYGLSDAFIITPEMDRLNRLEFYIKMNLNR